MENILFYIPIALVVISAVFAVLYGIDEKLAKKIAIRTVLFVVAVVAFALVLTLHGAARAEWIYATVTDSVPAVYKGEECYLVSVDINGEIKKYYSSQNLAEDTVVEIDYVNGRIENSREPESIWFPPIMLLGAVAPIIRQKKQGKVRAKTYAPCFWGQHKKSDKNAYIYHFGKLGIEQITIDTRPTGYVKYGESEEAKKTVCREVARGHQLGKPCIAWVYNPVTQQSEVISFAEVGIFERLAKYSAKVKTNLEATRREVFPEGFSRVFNEETCKEPKVDIIKVIYSKNGKEYRFYPIAQHKEGDFCCVEKVNEHGDVTYKNVQVVFVGKETKSSIETFCKTKNIKDLSKEYCRYAIDFPGAWADWGGSDPRVSEEDEPQDYDFEADFFAPSPEEIAEFQAMRDVYGYHLP